MANTSRLREDASLPPDAAAGRTGWQFVFPFGLYLAGGVLVFLFSSNTYSLFPTNRNAWFEWGLTLALLVGAVFMRRSARLRKFWPVAFALFAASFANVLNLWAGNWLAGLLPAAGSQAQFYAIDKLSQSILVVAALILLTLLSGDSLGSIFLKKGDLRQGLKFGFISFGVCAAIFIAIAVLQSGAPSSTGLAATGVSLETLLAAVPWILIFIFANSIMEELWFRGISLGRLHPLLGTAATVLVTALVFGSMHLGATYVTTAQAILFTSITFALGLVNGYVTLKTGSIWGSVLFHAGYDLFVIIPILAA